MRIAVVGAAGQVGRGLMRAFTRLGIPTFGITRNGLAAAPLQADGLEIRVGRVAEAGEADALLKDADVVVNCALEIDRPKRARARNEDLLTSLLAHAPSALVIHLSSIAVYGSCVDRTVSTFEHPRPDSTYGQEKLRLERFALETAQRLGRQLLILRLGHVYGPGQGISREVFDVLRERRWGLPFGGRLPSNAVHIDHLATAVPALASEKGRAPILNATDNPQRTWGAIYEMHAQAGTYAPVDAMSESESVRLRNAFRRMARMPLVQRVPSQVTAWARQLPLKSLVNVTAVRQATEAALLALPPRVEQMVDRRYAVFSAGQNLQPQAGDAASGPPPWYYSDGIGGAGLPEAAETPARTAQEIDALRAWHAEWAAPVWRVPLATGERA